MYNNPYDSRDMPNVELSYEACQWYSQSRAARPTHESWLLGKGAIHLIIESNALQSHTGYPQESDGTLLTFSNVFGGDTFSRSASLSNLG